MAEIRRDDNTRPILPDRVPRSPITGPRNETSVYEELEHERIVSAYKAALDSDAAAQAAEVLREENARLEAGRFYHSRYSKGQTCSDESARIFASFDARSKDIQPSEFWRFRDSEAETFGYF